MPGLAKVGKVSYNNFEFPAALSATLQAKPIWDRAKRTIMYNEYTFTIECVLTEEEAIENVSNGTIPGTIDPNANAVAGWDSIRRQLLAPAKGFIFEDQGFGDFKINTTGQVAFGATTQYMGYMDLVYGPKPKVLEWTPIGSNKACRIKWSVTLALNDCLTGITSQSQVGKFLQLNYNANWSINEEGLLSRTYNGVIEIPGNRKITGQDDRGITGSLGEKKYLDLIHIPIPDGFTRTQQYQLSTDKRKLNFFITDKETGSDNPYFPGTVQPNFTLSLANTTAAAHQQWAATLRGSVTVAKGYPRQYAFVMFGLILGAVFRRAALKGKKRQKKEKQPLDDKWSLDDIDGIIVMTRLSVSEEIFGRSMSFSASWLLNLGDEKTFLEASGLWVDLRNIAATEGNNKLSKRVMFNWDRWNESMTGVVNKKTRTDKTLYGETAPYRPQGNADLFYNASEDAIIDICTNKGIPLFNSRKATYPTDPISVYPKKSRYQPENTMISYETSISYDENTRTASHSVLKQVSGYRDDTQYGNYSYNKTDQISLQGVVESGSNSPSEENVDTIIQRRGPSSTIVVLTGKASRVAYPIPIPGIVDIAGRTPRLIRSEYTHKKVGYTLDGTPIHAAQWRKTYVVDGQMTGDINKKTKLFGDKLSVG